MRECTNNWFEITPPLLKYVKCRRLGKNMALLFPWWKIIEEFINDVSIKIPIFALANGNFE